MAGRRRVTAAGRRSVGAIRAPEQPLTPPPGIVTVNIDRSTGQLANGGNSREEYFIEGTQPTQQAVHEVGTTIIDNGEAQELF